jgi:hypothetical protein
MIAIGYKFPTLRKEKIVPKKSKIKRFIVSHHAAPYRAES